jgi:Xaa-Pro aminopeptidase
MRLSEAGTVQKMAYRARLSRLKKALEVEGLGGVVVVPGPNLRYLTGVDSLLLERPFVLLVPRDGEPNLVAPALEAGPYRKCPLPMSVHAWTDSQGPSKAIGRGVSGAGVRGKWGVEGRVPFLFFERLKRRASAEFEGAERLLQGLREVKDKEEVKLLRRSAEVLSRSFEGFPELLKEGATELEVAKGAADMIYSHGATKVDDVLVQSGARAADPHSLPSAKKLRRGEGVVVDVGSTFEGYYSDVTRTFCLGAAGEVEKVYLKVLEAEEKGIEASGEGAEVGGVDGAARGVLKAAGLGRYFIHRTGHGLGLEVHEAPYIVEGGRERLRRNMCFTVEPGAYIGGKLGVRIEDDVLVEGRRGVEITDPPREFGWWR